MSAARRARQQRMIPWPLLRVPIPRDCSPLGEKLLPDATPNYAYLDIGRWWEHTGNSGELEER